MGAVLTDLFTSGLGVDIALLFIGLEFVVLMWRGGAGSWPKTAFNLLLALGPGVCLMLALRCALTSAGIMWVILWLTASLPLHIGDVARRKF
jgi:hypothetical protein